MASVFDVAAYVLAKGGPMTAMKLQKLVYYSQAWHLVWEERELFSEPIEAWANGPVVRDLYNRHRHRWTLDATDTLGGDPAQLTDAERETIDLIVTSYGQHEPHWLSELTKREPPWRNTRTEARLHPMDRGNAVISTAAIYEYYDGLTQSDADCVDV